VSRAAARPDCDRTPDDDAALAVAILIAAFSTDAFVRWLAPTTSPGLFGPVVAESAAAGGLDLLDKAAAAVWLPVSAGGEANSGPLPPDLPARLRAYLELSATRHPPDRDHLHLQFIGVHPGHWGRGIGSTLLARGLARADDAAWPVYLEASSQRNARLYERHGFSPFGDPMVLPDGPTVWPMLREPGPRT